MAKTALWNRREVLGGLTGMLLATLGGRSRAAGGFPMIWSFESRSTELRLFKFEWSNLNGRQSIMGDHAMWLSSREPMEVPFMSEELEGVTDGLPEWIDLGWHSPVESVRIGPLPNDFKDDYTRAKKYEQRVYPRSMVPPSAIDEVRRSVAGALELHFIFDDSTVKLGYELYKKK